MTVRRLRVALVVHSLALGGAELIVQNLAKGLVARGIDVLVLPLRPGPAFYAEAFATLAAAGVVVGEPFRQRFASMGGLREGRSWALGQLRAFAPDIVHSHCELPDLVNASFRNEPFLRVRTVHNERFFGDRWGVAFERVLNRVGRFDRIVCISERTYRNNAGRNRVLIYNGLVCGPSHLRPRQPAAEPTVHLVGRLSRQKGQNEFLAYCEKRFSGLDRLPFSLRIFGAGGDASAIARIESRSQGRVVFEGVRLDQEELYAGAWWVIISSRFEGLSSVMVEAVMRGVPVVSMRVSGAADVLDQIGGGKIVDSYDALVDALGDGPPPSVSADVRMRVGQLFSVQAATDAHLEMYLELARRSVAQGAAEDRRQQ